jgi:Protein of unknown function, DUF547
MKNYQLVKNTLLFSIFVLYSGLINAQDYTRYDSLLQTYVKESTGRVNYKGIKENRTLLDAAVADLQYNPPAADASRNARLAYWMNVYNLFTIKLIVDNYPVKRITDLDNGKPWDVKRIEIGGKNYSLNQIENEIIRPQFKDSRIHFGINCAAISCPPLLNQAFTSDNVQSLLSKRTRRFIRSGSNTLSEDEVVVSKIFEWYAQDFGNIIEYLNKYATVKIKPGATVSYKDYNWSLNEQ